MRITRRGLLVGAGVAGGGLLIGSVGIATYIAAYDQKRAQQAVLGQSKMVTQWISIAPDNRVTLHGPHTEMGQGTQTSLLQILLDELDADPATTGYELAPADPAFTLSDMFEGMLAEMGGVTLEDGWTDAFLRDVFARAASLAGAQFTGGSMSVRLTGWYGIRRVAAAARAMLAQAGADALGVPLAEVRTADSHVHHDGSGRSLSYGELTEAAALLPVPGAPTYKDPSTYRFIGTRFPRFDLPEKVFGEPVYGIDVAVPGMRYAAVAPPPLAQGRVTGLSNRAEVEARRGVEAVVVMEDAVAVVADNPWRAEQAVRQLDILCEPPDGGPIDDTALRERRVAAVEAGGDEVMSHGDGLEALDGVGVVKATYVTPYYVHVPMEPMNATVWEEGGKHHVATGTQGPLNTRYIAAEALGRSFDDVVLHAKTMGGGFGRRNALVAASINWVVQACRIQKAVGGAVKMTWSREAGVRMSTYHPADAAHLRARLGADGRPTAWLIDAYAPLFPMEEVMPPYQVPHWTVRSVAGEPALPYGYWRSVVAFTTTHFYEAFIDELAGAAEQDPLDYRLALLTEQQGAVLRRVREMSGWQGPKVGDRGYGVAFIRSFGSTAAAVVEVSLERGRPKVHQVWCAVDCGIPVNPGSVEAQAQGGLYWGLSAALYEKLAFEGGRMVQSNFHDYRVAAFHDAPRIHVDVLRDTGSPIGGVGELTTPLAAPALVNALAALAERRRTLPVV